MKSRFAAVTAAAAVVVIVALMLGPTAGKGNVDFPRTGDGKPDLSGIWQAVNTAHWDIQDHSARLGPVVALGAAFSIPAGQGVVEGEDIPYKPEAVALKQENAANWMTRDPEIKCFMPGVPRATYMPYPFQIVQTPDTILMAYEFAQAARPIRMTPIEDAPVESWMGWSRGRWENDTLVVEVTGFNGKSWFDRAGNYQSSSLKVVERYTPRSHDALNYEVTIEDPTLYTRPWKMRMPLYRRLDDNMQYLEYKCVEFAEPVMYGPLRKQVSSN